MNNDIERVHWSDLGVKRFADEYANALKPVIVKGAIDHWGALGKWTPSFFREEHGDRTVIVDRATWKLGDLIGAIERSSIGAPAPYLRNDLLDKWPESVQQDIAPIPRCTEGNWLESKALEWLRHWRSPELYIGGAGAKFPVLHYDVFHLHAFLMQLYGEKEYLVYPPEQTQFMYRGEGVRENKSSVEDPENPDLEQFPDFAKARGSRFRLYPGETLFVPCGWWHTAKIISTSITTSLNGLTRRNWADFGKDLIADTSRASSMQGYKTKARLAMTNLQLPD